MLYLGIDIGGTGVKLGIVDDDCRVIDTAVVPTDAHRPAEEIVTTIIAAAKPLCEQYQPIAVGIGSAGRIDPPNGTVLRAGNLPTFWNVPLCALVGEALGLPVAIENDANCALLAEAHAGVCRDCRDVLMVTLGTGVGGAIMIDGNIYRAHNFRAGEIGHFILDHKGAPCPCGLHGCYEQYASATALIRRAEEAAAAHPDSLLAASPIDGKAVFDAAKAGCPVAKDVLSEWGRYVAMGLNSMVKIFMPQCIVLAGGVAKAGEELLSLLTPHLLPEAVIRFSALGGNAGIIGAALTGKGNEVIVC